jgi:hypothetical protein
MKKRGPGPPGAPTACCACCASKALSGVPGSEPGRDGGPAPCSNLTCCCTTDCAAARATASASLAAAAAATATYDAAEAVYWKGGGAGDCSGVHGGLPCCRCCPCPAEWDIFSFSSGKCLPQSSLAGPGPAVGQCGTDPVGAATEHGECGEAWPALALATKRESAPAAGTVHLSSLVLALSLALVVTVAVAVGEKSGCGTHPASRAAWLSCMGLAAAILGTCIKPYGEKLQVIGAGFPCWCCHSNGAGIRSSCRVAFYLALKANKGCTSSKGGTRRLIPCTCPASGLSHQAPFVPQQ